MSMQDLPAAEDLVAVVAEFVRDEVLPRLDGRLAFEARVAANVLDLVGREMRLASQAQREEGLRLEALLDRTGPLDDLNRELCTRIRQGRLSLSTPGLLDHLRATTAAKLRVDQPGYETWRRIDAAGWNATPEEAWPTDLEQDEKP
jgi:uncharacterized protein DUF6285